MTTATPIYDAVCEVVGFNPARMKARTHETFMRAQRERDYFQKEAARRAARKNGHPSVPVKKRSGKKA